MPLVGVYTIYCRSQRVAELEMHIVLTQLIEFQYRVQRILFSFWSYSCIQKTKLMDLALIIIDIMYDNMGDAM